VSYTNIPANLYDMFNTINQRITKLELARSGPQDTADGAQSTAVSAQTTAQQAYVQALAAGVQATAAAYTAGVALASANGKNQVHYSTSGPSGSGTDGDIWFQTDISGNVLYQYILKSGTWTNSPITSTVIASLDAGKITTGTLTSIAIYAGSSGQFQVSAAGALTATNATIQGTVTASGGKIGGFSIVSNDYLNYGTTYIYGNSTSSGYAILDISKTIGASKLQTLSSSSDSLYSSGGLQVAGLADITGNLQVHAMSSTSATGVVWSASNSRFYLTTSTERHKTNINPLPAADYLSKLLQLEPVTFTYKPEFTDNPNLLISGLIAEKVAEIPEFSTVVNLDANGLPESLAYDRLAMFMLPALKQINDRLTALEAK
jgi:Chaperone of endosialidase